MMNEDKGHRVGMRVDYIDPAWLLEDEKVIDEAVAFLRAHLSNPVTQREHQNVVDVIAEFRKRMHYPEDLDNLTTEPLDMADIIG